MSAKRASELGTPAFESISTPHSSCRDPGPVSSFGKRALPMCSSAKKHGFLSELKIGKLTFQARHSSSAVSCTRVRWAIRRGGALTVVRRALTRQVKRRTLPYD